MSQKELQRVKVIENAVAGHISVAEAARLLQLSPRQVKRLKQRAVPGEVDWVRHGNRGGRSPRRTADTTRAKVVKLASGKYAGFNDSHLTEKLQEEEKMVLSRETVRRILRGAGRSSPQKRRAPRYRSRRERRPRRGMMVLTDGSRERWLEQRGPALTLIGFQDDATGDVLAARFQLEYEDALGYLKVLRMLVDKHGVPLSLYRDRHGAFQRNDGHWSEQEQLAGRQTPTQLGRVLEELGIAQIAALSPQAKGRIERLWKTFQDRLRSELRLAKAKTVEQANAVLERFVKAYNRKFSKPARETGKRLPSLGEKGESGTAVQPALRADRGQGSHRQLRCSTDPVAGTGETAGICRQTGGTEPSTQRRTARLAGRQGNLSMPTAAGVCGGAGATAAGHE